MPLYATLDEIVFDALQQNKQGQPRELDLVGLTAYYEYIEYRRKLYNKYSLYSEEEKSEILEIAINDELIQLFRDSAEKKIPSIIASLKNNFKEDYEDHTLSEWKKILEENSKHTEDKLAEEFKKISKKVGISYRRQKRVILEQTSLWNNFKSNAIFGILFPLLAIILLIAIAKATEPILGKEVPNRIIDSIIAFLTKLKS